MSERKTWTKESFEDAFKPYLEHLNDPSPQGRKKARILRAATELFEKQGYRKTSVDEVARRAEVAKGTVYLYFETKAKLLLHCVAVQKAVLRKSFAPLFTGEVPPEQQLHYYVRIMLGSARQVPLASRLLRGDGELEAAMEEAGGAEFQENIERGSTFAMQMIEAAAPGRFDEEEKRRRAYAIMTLGFLSVVLLEERLRLGEPYEQVVSTISDIIVYGTVNLPPPERG